MDTNAICFVEDNEDFAIEITEYLQARGFLVEHLNHVDGLAEHLATAKPVLVILDQFVGAQDTLFLLSALRGRYSGGILVLTANTDDIDRVVALESGADDYVSKVAGPRELLARMRAIIRRLPLNPKDQGGATPTTTSPKPGRRWVASRTRGEIIAPDGQQILLTQTQFATLMFLSEHAGRTVSRDDISRHVFKREFSPFDRTVDNTISRIRKALAGHGAQSVLIRPIRGEGYLFSGFGDGNCELAESGT